MPILARRCRTLLVFLLLCFPPFASAQSAGSSAPQATAAAFSLSEAPERVITLDGRFRFHPGDDAGWSRPDFDDSKWDLVPADRSWPINGQYKGLGGFAWYRFRVEVPAGAGALAIEIPRVYTTYQLFADGVLLGSPGGRPLGQPIRVHREIFALPPGTGNAHTITFALRCWQWPGWAAYLGGGPQGGLRLGSAAQVQEDARLRAEEVVWTSTDGLLLAFLEVVAGSASLALFLLRSGEREYLWFSLLMFFSAAYPVMDLWFHTHTGGLFLSSTLDGAQTSLVEISAAFFYVSVLRSKTRLLWPMVVLVVSMPLLEVVDGSVLSVATVNVVESVVLLAFSAWVIALLVAGARKGLADARLLLFPVLLQQATIVTLQLLWTLFTAGWQTSFDGADVTLVHHPFAFTLLDLTAVIYLLAILAILIGRFARTSREGDRAQADLQAVRSLQNVLIPSRLPTVPGFTVESVYRPAQEVGGDFFQIIPLVGDETLAILGDVAGKGLTAAMTVSLLVGAARSLAETTHAPAEILAGLNRRLLGRDAGFTTVIALRLRSSGEVVLANAGHLAPYWNGREVGTEPALPLGLDGDAEFRERSFRMQPGDRLTLLTDGIPEATCRKQLFGFERTAAVSTQSAAAIADEAIRFGQNDDITVLALIAS